MQDKMPKPEVALPLPPQDDPEGRLNAAMARTFSTPEGQVVLQYLRQSYINTILPPSATDGEIRYREGQRSVVAVIEQRKHEGENPRGRTNSTRTRTRSRPGTSTGGTTGFATG